MFQDRCFSTGYLVHRRSPEEPQDLVHNLGTKTVITHRFRTCSRVIEKCSESKGNTPFTLFGVNVVTYQDLYFSYLSGV